MSSKAATIGDDTNELSNITAEFLLFDFEHALLGFPIALDPHSFPLSMPYNSRYETNNQLHQKAYKVALQQSNTLHILSDDQRRMPCPRKIKTYPV